MTIASVRVWGCRRSLSVTLAGMAVAGCSSVGLVDDDVKEYAVDDGSLEPIGLYGAALEEPGPPGIVRSVITDAILALAIAEEGKGPNDVGVSTGYPLSDYAADITGGWCSEFVSWAYWRGGCPFSEQWGDYPWMIGGSEQIRAWFVEHSRFVYQTDPEWETYVPQPGDYIRYNNPSGGHSGIVRSVEGTTLLTVEGNVNNIVMLRSLRDYRTGYSDPADGIDGFGVNPCGDAGTGGGGGEGGGGSGSGGEIGTGGFGTGGFGTGGTGTGGLGTGGFGTGGTGIGGIGTGGIGTGGIGTGGIGTGGAGSGGVAPSSGGGLGASGGVSGAGGTPLPSGGALAGGGTPGVGGSAPSGGASTASGGMEATTGGAVPSAGGAGSGVVGSGGSTGGQALSGTGAMAAPSAEDAPADEDGGCACAAPGGAGASGRSGLAALLAVACWGRRRRRVSGHAV